MFVMSKYQRQLPGTSGFRQAFTNSIAEFLARERPARPNPVVKTLQYFCTPTLTSTFSSASNTFLYMCSDI
jgi:hypothetical protein